MANKKRVKRTMAELRAMVMAGMGNRSGKAGSRTIIFRTKKGPLIKRFKSKASAARAYRGWTSTGATAKYV